MYGLIDCNNFYVSCERVFNPSLVGKPVVVLSNNDGVAVSRSNEAKSLGINMAEPFYKWRDIAIKNNVIFFSSNYTLYGDMSHRVMTMLRDLAPDLEIYSIDEAYLDFTGITENLEEFGREITRKVTKGTGIPVSLGIAPTKTLAKLANRFAKKYPGYKNVCIIDTEEKRIKALKLTEVGDVWGIGYRSVKKLKGYGINTAYDFMQKPREWVRKYLTITGERTWLELHGEPCIDLENAPVEKRQICTSRSFGKNVTDLHTLSEAVAMFAEMGAEKLRRQKSCAGAIYVFIFTNKHRTDQPQVYLSHLVKLPVPTNSGIEIVKHAKVALEAMFKEGYQYKKAGVVMTDIIDQTSVQSNLFDIIDRPKHSSLMSVMDDLNRKYHRHQIYLASQGTDHSYRLRTENLSPQYTTKLGDIIKVK